MCVFGALALGISLGYAGANDAISFATRFHTYLPFALAAAITWTLLNLHMSLDGFKGGWHLPAILSKLIVGVTSLMVVLFALAFLTSHFYSRLVLFYFSLFFLLGVIGVRCLARVLVATQLKDMADHRCVILGHGTIARELVRKIASHPELSFQVVGFLFLDQSEASNGFAGSFGAPSTSIKTLQVLEFLLREKVRKLIIAMPWTNGSELRNLIAQCRNASIQVFLVPELYDLYLSRAELTEIDGLPLLSLQEYDPPAAYFAIKRSVDLVMSVGILLAFSAVLLLAALFVRIKKGKAFRTELRCGKDAVPFRMYRLNVDRHASNPKPYERLFVRWSLTELPQMWNVLRGDMSLVGPRPESPERVKHYSEWQRRRLKVRPGVTGLAQVHGLREQHSSEDKTRFDLQYIFSWSPLLDLSLIVQTVWTLQSRGLAQEPDLSDPSPLRGGEKDLLVEEEFTGAHRS